MEIRILQSNEYPAASRLAGIVYDSCILPTAGENRTTAYFRQFIDPEHLAELASSQGLVLWGAFLMHEGKKRKMLVGVSGMNAKGLVSMLYVHPQFQNRKIGCKLVETMRQYASAKWRLPAIYVNATPVQSAGFFEQCGFEYLDDYYHPDASGQILSVSMGARSTYRRVYPRKKIPLAARIGISALFLLAALGSGLAYVLLV